MGVADGEQLGTEIRACEARDRARSDRLGAMAAHSVSVRYRSGTWGKFEEVPADVAHRLLRGCAEPERIPSVVWSRTDDAVAVVRCDQLASVILS